MQTPRQRVETALRHGRPDRVPFTVYECMPPSPAALEELKVRGLCIVNRIGVVNTHHPNCKITTADYEQDGKPHARQDIETPVGSLHTTWQKESFTAWRKDYLFATPDDYKALAFYLNDAVFEPAYGRVAELEAEGGDTTILRTGFGLEPLQSLISGDAFDPSEFALQWMDNRDEILKLYDIIVEKRRQVYPLVAKSPVLHANYGGNVVPEIIGLRVFQEHYVPHYQEAAEVMHAHGKLIGCHFDANCRVLADAIAGTDLDYIEAFTPAPDTDMSLREAREAWPDKAIWINYPSSIHLRPEEGIAEATRDLMAQAEPLDGFMIGITEDVPPHRVDGNYRAIMRAMEDYETEREARA